MPQLRQQVKSPRIHVQKHEVDSHDSAATLEQLKRDWKIARDQRHKCDNANCEHGPVNASRICRTDCKDEARLDSGED